MKHWFDVLSALKFFSVCIDSHIFEHLIQHIRMIFKYFWMEVYLYTVYSPLNRATVYWAKTIVYIGYDVKNKEESCLQYTTIEVYVTHVSVQ